MKSIPSSVNDHHASEELYKQARKVLPGGISRNTIYRRPHPIYAASAYGCYVTDIEGDKRVDFANNMAALIHGHAHPKIIAAVTEQLKRGTAFNLATEAEVRYAEHLCNRNAGFEKLRFVNSGTEAVMAMIKAARAFTGKPKIAKVEGAYHGVYDFAEVSQTANPSNWGNIDKPNSVPVAVGTPETVLKNVIIFPFNDIKRTLHILDQHADELACVLIDLIPHRVGLMPASKEFINALRQWTLKNNVLLAFDEVITFRTEYSGAQSNYDVKPDLTSLGKIIGGGFPAGAFAGRHEIMNVLDPTTKKLLLPHSGTFSANPITMTAGLLAMEMFDEAAVKKLNALTSKAVKQVEEAIKIAAISASVTGAGSMFRIHFTEKPPTHYREAWIDPPSSKITGVLLDYLYSHGIIMFNTITATLSTVMTQLEIDHLSDALLKSFRLIKPELDKMQESARK